MVSYYSGIIVLLASPGALALSIIGIVLSVITFMSAIFLLVAVSKHKSEFLMPWLITFGISAIYNFGMLIWLHDSDSHIR